MRKTITWLLSVAWVSLFSAAVFSDSPRQHPPSGALPASTETLMAVGDLNFHNGLEAKILADPEYPWLGVKDVLRRATVLIGNLESPLSNRGFMYTKKTWLLRADPRTALALRTAGFKVVTLANNHMMDYGPPALLDTLFTLKRLGILHTGAGMSMEKARQAVIYKTPQGVRFAFLAYSLTFPEEFWAKADRPGTVYGSPVTFLADIKKARQIADHVVVSFHWGEELKSELRPYQKSFAHLCIDAGASLVLGHHPHVLQGLEVYHGGLVAYSLGNFAFGSLSHKTRDSIILAVEYDRAGLIRARLYPVNINNYEVAFQTQFHHGVAAERVLQDLRAFSAEFQTPIITAGEIGVIPIRPAAP